VYGNYVNASLEEHGGDLSRQTKFSVDITLPTPVSKNVSKEKMDVLCKNISIPAIKNEPIEVKYKGHIIPVSGRTTYEQRVTLTFLLDDKHILKEAFTQWLEGMDSYTMGAISDVNGGVKGLSSKNGEITIKAKDFIEYYTPATYTFKNVFPVSVSGLEYDGSSTSVYNEINVEFAFTHIESVMADDTDFSSIFQDTKSNIMGSIGRSILGNEERLDIVPALGDFFTKFK